MQEIRLNREEFQLFNEDDQFGFFYDDDGYPTKDSREQFIPNIIALFKKYEYISIDVDDNIFGIVGDDKELLMENVSEAYDIAQEVKE